MAQRTIATPHSRVAAPILAENILSDSKHREWDEALMVFVQFLSTTNANGEVRALRTMILLHVMAQIEANLGDRARKLKSSNEAAARLLDDNDPLTSDPIKAIIDEAITTQTFKNVRNLNALRLAPPVQGSISDSDMDSTLATEKAWRAPFSGNAHQRLYDTMQRQWKSRDALYARYLAIVQSSGTGKSRMIDELSKEHLVIPINLRVAGSGGYPPADPEVLSFLTGHYFTPEDALNRSYAFLLSLFRTTSKYLQDISAHVDPLVDGVSPDDVRTPQQKFRLLMASAQSFKRQGEKRQQFYVDVIAHAKKLLGTVTKKTADVTTADTTEGQKVPGSPTGNDTELRVELAGEELIRCIKPGLPDGLHMLKDEDLQVVLAIDEAHVLNDPPFVVGESPAPTRFSQFRHALRALRRLPIFSVFLSTAGKIQDFIPPRKNDPSNRIDGRRLHVPSPFTELGFDQMLGDFGDISNYVVDDFSRVGFMVKFGRPLFATRYEHGNRAIQFDIVPFAAGKLIADETVNLTSLSDEQKLACMSVRLALEFNARTTEAQTRERTQVERYMRICILGHKDFETMVSISPSEPLLAEASRYIMNACPTFDLPGALLKEMELSSLDNGDRGELIAEMLLILAVDAAIKKRKRVRTTTMNQTLDPNGLGTQPVAVSLSSFITALVDEQWHQAILQSMPSKSRTKTQGKRTFERTFSQSKVYFTHFIKTDDPQVISRDFLWRLIARGAAVLCANGQAGVDIAIPFMYLDQKLERQTISAIFIQVKNDAKFNAQPNLFLFDMMNPFFLRFFDMDEKEPFPVIRMVFALASETSTVKVIEPNAEPRLPRPMKEDAQKALVSRRSPPYTAFDIWCAKACGNTFAVIQGNDDTYEKLLKISKVFPGAYSSGALVAGIEAARRSMNPGTSTNAEHWGNWCQSEVREATEAGWTAGVDFDSEDEPLDENACNGTTL